MKKTLLLCFSVALSIAVWAQERTVAGKVTSADDGSPLPGVNVLLQGTTVGTVTDAGGTYTVVVPDGKGLLTFSFIGLLTQEVEIGDRTVLDVSMATDVRQLSEVIVTAQGILKTRNELSYAAQTVNGEALSNTRDNNFVNAISGKVAGVQITKNNSMGGSTNVVIRGWKSLTGNNQALFVDRWCADR